MKIRPLIYIQWIMEKYLNIPMYKLFGVKSVSIDLANGKEKGYKIVSYEYRGIIYIDTIEDL